MGGDAYRRLMARSKGGRTAQAKGTAHRWTSETARKAAKKLWATRWRKVNGMRIGVPAKKRASVDRQALRERYKNGRTETSAITYEGFIEGGHVWAECDGVSIRPISERTALRKLGHLPSPTPAIPLRVVTRIKLIDGKTVAFNEPE